MSGGVCNGFESATRVRNVKWLIMQLKSESVGRGTGKAFDDDLDVDTTYVNGSIGNAKW